jgi:extracellular elastinolytic metalloproteinase
MDPGRGRAQRLVPAAVAVVLALPATAAAVTPGRGADSPLFDVRAVSGAPATPSADAPRTRATRARAALRRRFGSGLALGVDPATGTTRSVQRLDGALTAPASGPRATVARGWLRDQRELFGVDAGTVDGLGVASAVTAGAAGITTVRFQQRYRGLPVFDGGVQVALDRGGRVLSAAGSPLPEPAVDSVAPALDAGAAVQAFERTTGPGTAVPGTPPQLVLFPRPAGPRLAWRVVRRQVSGSTDEAVVDADSGRVLFRQSLTTSSAPATIYPSFPGADTDPAYFAATQQRNAPSQPPVDLEARGWLASGAPTLSGPYVHAFADLNDDNPDPDPAHRDLPEASEEIRRGANGFVFDLRRFPCTPGADASRGPACTWDRSTPGNVTSNKNADSVQAFALANRFRDHLAAQPIGFDGFSANNGDPLLMQTLDGAQTAADGPDADHVNNANMTTYPDGQSPVMQMYLFESPYRAIDGGTDAATVWHEYTHGLSGRLVKYDDGFSALSALQSGALGEGWSDFFALDELDREGLQPDDPNVPAEMDIGHYSDLPSTPSTRRARTQAADCPVGPSSVGCPGRPQVGAGGYTFGDLGKISGGGPEVHYDGEIWLETLWDLRAALIAQTRSTPDGSRAAEQLVTDAMRISPPQPSFLDQRNAILAADTAANGGAYHDLIWMVFARRGMGWFAATQDAADQQPTEDFHTPPDAGGDTGSLAGRVTDAETGAALARVTVGPAVPNGEKWSAVTDADGRYVLPPGLPIGSYARIQFTGPAGYDPAGAAATVTTGATTVLNAAMHRDWSSAAGGARLAEDVDGYCGPRGLIDEFGVTDWSAQRPIPTQERPTPPAPSTTVLLPAAIDIAAIGLDPAAGCGDGVESALRGFTLEAVRSDGSSAPLLNGSFSPGAAGRLNLLVPSGNAKGVLAVRLTLLSPQSNASPYIDVAALSVYGRPAAPPEALAPTPAGSPSATTTTTPISPTPTTPTPSAPPSKPRAAPPSVRVATRGRKGGTTATVLCVSRCRLSISATVGTATAKRLRSPRRTVLTAHGTVTGGVSTRVAMTLPAKVRASAKRAGLRTLTVLLQVRATDAGGRSTLRRATVRIAL